MYERHHVVDSPELLQYHIYSSSVDFGLLLLTESLMAIKLQMQDTMYVLHTTSPIHVFHIDI